MTSTTEAATGTDATTGTGTGQSTTATDSTATAQTATGDATKTGQGDPADLGENGQKVLRAERAEKNAAVKRAKDLEAKLKAIEDAQLSEVEKAKRDAADATERANKLERDALRFRVANEKQLPAWLTDRLIGDTEEELAADADRVLAELKTAGAAGPRPDLSQGSSGANGDQALNGDPLLRDLKIKLGIS